MQLAEKLDWKGLMLMIDWEGPQNSLDTGLLQ
jgi:hypothetical protein